MTNKTKRWSKCLDQEWSTLRSVCKQMHYTEKEGLRLLEERSLNRPQILYDIVLDTFRTMLLSYDVNGETLHLYFMDKELRDFLCSYELIDFDELKSYVLENGHFYPVKSYGRKEPSQINDFPFCIHIPYEKHGYTFNCQIINNKFNLVAIHKQGFMLQDYQYKELLKIPVEKLQPEYKDYIKEYRLAFNTIAYINYFRDCVKDGAPDVVVDNISRNENKITIETSKEIHEEIVNILKTPSIRSPHFKRRHLMYLKDERYTNKRGQLVWRNACMIKGKAKTVYTNEELLQRKETIGNNISE